MDWTTLNKKAKTIISKLFLLGFLFFLIACANDKEEVVEVPVVKVNFDKSNRISDSILFNPLYVPLETNEECIIGTINKLKIIDNCIYAMDMRYNLGIYKFDINGNFLYKICNIGKGPGEFIEISDFLVTDEYVIVLSFKKILFYSKLNGEFEHEKSIDFMPDNLLFDRENSVFFFQNRELGPNKLLKSHVVRTNSNFKSKNEYLAVNRREMLEPDRLYKFKGDIYLSSPRFLDNVLYQLSGDKAIPTIRFDFGKDNPPNNYISDRSIKVTDNIPYPSIRMVMPSNKFGMFEYHANLRIYLGFYSTETYKSISGYAITSLSIPITSFDQIIGDKIVSHFDASSFIKRAALCEYHRPDVYKHHYAENGSFRKAIDGIIEYSNPVVVINELDTALLSKILR